MSRPRLWPSFLAGVLLASLGGNVWQFVAAHPPRIFRTLSPRPGPDDGPPPLDLARELSLSAEQRAAVREAVEGLEAERTEAEDRLADRVDALRAELLGEEPEEARVEALEAEVAALRTRILALRIEVLRRFRAILTPEQRATLAGRR